MPPKSVFALYKDTNDPVIAGIVYGDKFTRMLRALRKKHKNGDLQNEDKPKAIEWSKSAAKQFLKKCFRDETISANYQDAKQVWTDHCKDDNAFKRMQCNDAFVRRLNSVRNDHLKKVERCQKDLEAYNSAKKNHPTPALNIRGEPQWHGSAAQNFLRKVWKQCSTKRWSQRSFGSQNPSTKYMPWKHFVIISTKKEGFANSATMWICWRRRRLTNYNTKSTSSPSGLFYIQVK